jgi:hypothetical protein
LSESPIGFEIVHPVADDLDAPRLQAGQRTYHLVDEGAALPGVERPPLGAVVVQLNEYLLHEGFPFG